MSSCSDIVQSIIINKKRDLNYTSLDKYTEISTVLTNREATGGSSTTNISSPSVVVSLSLESHAVKEYVSNTEDIVLKRRTKIRWHSWERTRFCHRSAAQAMQEQLNVPRRRREAGCSLLERRRSTCTVNIAICDQPRCKAA